MDYNLTGTFVESCDCYLICPCWVGEDADDGRCTGLVAWRVRQGSTIGALTLGADRTVVCVTTHLESRSRAGNSQSVVLVDDGATPEEFRLLAAAFTGTLNPNPAAGTWRRAKDPLAALAKVTGPVRLTEQAAITMDGPEPGRAGWSLTVSWGGGQLVHTRGRDSEFDGAPQPLTLSHAALTEEFQVVDRTVTAQRTDHLEVTVAALPGGYLRVTGRSGMSGRFHYRFRDRLPRARKDPERELEAQH